MPTLRYPLDPHGPKRLELAWEGQYRNFTVKLDDQVLGRVAGAKALASGQRLPLPDGSTLELKTAGTLLANELRVLRDGRPLPGSASDPAMRLRTTYQLIFFIAAVNLVMGLLGGLLGFKLLVELGLGWGTFIIGGLYLILGLLVRQRSLTALLLTVLLYGFETVMGLVVPALTGGLPNVGGLFVRALFLWILLMGFPALRDLSRAAASAPAQKAA